MRNGPATTRPEPFEEATCVTSRSLRHVSTAHTRSNAGDHSHAFDICAVVFDGSTNPPRCGVHAITTGRKCVPVRGPTCNMVARPSTLFTGAVTPRDDMSLPTIPLLIKEKLAPMCQLCQLHRRPFAPCCDMEKGESSASAGNSQEEKARCDNVGVAMPRKCKTKGHEKEPG
jgi:hypothetical protein